MAPVLLEATNHILSFQRVDKDMKDGERWRKMGRCGERWRKMERDGERKDMDKLTKLFLVRG